MLQMHTFVLREVTNYVLREVFRQRRRETLWFGMKMPFTKGTLHFTTTHSCTRGAQTQTHSQAVVYMLLRSTTSPLSIGTVSTSRLPSHLLCCGSCMQFDFREISTLLLIIKIVHL